MRAARSSDARRRVVAVFAFAAMTLVSWPASAASGDLDTSFAGDGVRTVTFPDTYSYADEVAVQPDGRVLVLGTAHSSVGITSDFALVRLRSGGGLDPTFGDGGRVTTDFGGRYDEGFALALQDDGKIVAAGSSTGYPSIARYLPDGSLDRSFDRDGRLTLAVPGQARDVAIASSGRIVVAVGDGQAFSAVRLRPRGRLDTTFGSAGVVHEDFSLGGGVSTRSVALEGGDVLLGGSVLALDSTTRDDWGVARFDGRGDPDPGFGVGGLTMTDFAGSGPDVLEDLVVQPDGMIVAAGQSSVEPGSADQSSDVTVARYDETGTLDQTFGDGGWTRTDLGSYFDDGRSVALGPDGRIVVASDVYEDANAQAAAVRYTAAGDLDPSFAGDGVAVVDTPSTSDQAFGVATRGDGRILIAGSHATFDPKTGTSFTFLVARFLA